MKKLKRLIFVFSLLLIAVLILFKNLNNIDEIYNYNFGRNIAAGKLIYRDFNCIVFPIFPLIIGAIVKIFGQEIIMFRIVQIVAFVILELLAFKVLKFFDKDKNIFIHFLIIIYIGFIAIYCTVEYNFMIMLVLFAILNLELKENKNAKDEILIGLLIRNLSGIEANSGNIYNCWFYNCNNFFKD